MINSTSSVTTMGFQPDFIKDLISGTANGYKGLDSKSATLFAACCKQFNQAIYSNDFKLYWKKIVKIEFKNCWFDYKFKLNVDWVKLFKVYSHRNYQLPILREKAVNISSFSKDGFFGEFLISIKKNLENKKAELDLANETPSEALKTSFKTLHIVSNDLDLPIKEKIEIIADYYEMLFEDNKSKKAYIDTSKLYMSLKPFVEELSKFNANYKAQYLFAFSHTSDYTPAKEQAYKYYSLSARQGYAPAFFELGYCFKKGSGTPMDSIEALRHNQVAADKGYIPALNELGKYYMNAEDVLNNKIQAFTYFQRSAELQDPIGLISLAYCHEKGVGTPVDLKEALKYYKLSADLGNKLAQWTFAYYNEEGLGILKNQKIAFKYYKLVADQGQASICTKIALSYETGLGVALNKDKAFVYYKRSSTKHVPNNFDPVLFTHNGQKIIDRMQSLVFNEQSLWAQNMLATFYETGKYVEINRDLAFMYYKLSANPLPNDLKPDLSELFL